jgi:hypothetical protein
VVRLSELGVAAVGEIDTSRHLAYAAEAVGDARCATLSRKKAQLAAFLVDAYVDRLFAAIGAPAGDILAFRADLAAARPALALVFDLVAGRAELVIEAVEVPIADYGKLSVEDYMVSLYNHNTVQRVRIATPDGRRADIHAVLAEAIAGFSAER